MTRKPKTYDVFVVLAHVHREGRLVPGAGAVRCDDESQVPNGWHDLVHPAGTLAVWRVDRTNVTQAKDLVLAHLAGHAPAGVQLLWDKKWPVPDNAPAEHWARQDIPYRVQGGTTTL
jgi:hypothetical protein